MVKRIFGDQAAGGQHVIVTLPPEQHVIVHHSGDRRSVDTILQSAIIVTLKDHNGSDGIIRHYSNECADSNNVNGIRKLVSKEVQQMIQFSVQSITSGPSYKNYLH